MKRILMFLLLLAGVLTLLCVVAVAEEAPEVYSSGNYSYTLDDEGNATISKYNGSELSVAVPGELDGHPVVGIGRAAFLNENQLVAVTIPGSVADVGDEAFKNCNSLVKVTMDEGVQTIGSTAFYRCPSLSTVILPESLTRIGDSAFALCHSLEELTIPKNVNAIGKSVFQNCVKLARMEIPCGLSSISDSMFYGCSNLAEVTIPESVTGISSYAFRNCTSLDEVTIPLSVTQLGVFAFGGCAGLTEITIPGGVASISSSAFSDCSALAAVTICEGVQSIGYNVFNGCTSLKSVTIPGSTLVQIGEGAFEGCSQLEEVMIQEGLARINKNAFHNCAALADIWYSGSEADWDSIYFESDWDLGTDPGLIVHCDCPIVTFDPNGGTVSPAFVVTRDGVLPALPAAECRGSTFRGWYNSRTGINSFAEGDEVSADRTLYAQWTANTVYWSLDVIDLTNGAHMQGGRIEMTVSMQVGDEVSVIPYGDCLGGSNYIGQGLVQVDVHAVPAEDYVFLGWFVGETKDAFQQTLRPVERLGAEDSFSFELTEDGVENAKRFCAVFAPVYRSIGDLSSGVVLPANISFVRRSAFQGDESIRWAYIPEECEIGANAFEDCGWMVVYGYAGSPAEGYCARHDNCLFVPVE